MAGSRGSEYLTPPALAAESSAASLRHSSSYYSAGSESLVESWSCIDIAQQIENSKSHWSQLGEFDSDEDEVAEMSNVQEFKTLQMHSPWGLFFRTFGDHGGMNCYGELVVGEKFAEGGQAELYHAQVKWDQPDRNEYDLKYGRKWVLKVFKKGTYLRHLKSQWPHGLFELLAERWQVLKKLGKIRVKRNCCDVYCGMLLKDGRFAFLLEKEDEDLRSLIDRNMLENGHGCGPFPKELGERIIFQIAVGMDWLHRHNIVHRDLKASNVLLSQWDREKHLYSFYISDFECSIGVVGTGFWRAPEILQACKDRNINHHGELFTKAVDVYSFGITCYEILTGKYPFEDHPWSDYDLVLNGHRPEVPEYVDDWTRRLLNWCLHSNPTDRPSFGEIRSFLLANSSTCRKLEQYRREYIQDNESDVE